MNHYRCSALSSLALTFFLTVLTLGSPPPDTHTNIVIILVDDLGWSDLACYGADLHETPNIDRLAAEGVRFTDAYSASPVCSPTRASIMTGKHPARLHMTIWHEGSLEAVRDRELIPPQTVANLPHSEVTVAEVLKNDGYATAHVGKWHLGAAGYYPETQGFDVNIGGTFWGAPPTFFYPYRGAFGSRRELRYVPGLTGGRKGEYLTDRLTSEAIAWLGSKSDGSFFLHLAFHTVHTPIEGKPEIVEKFRQKLSPELRHQNAEFAAMVKSLDENVGLLLAKLEQLGVADETAVFFLSDNGGYIGRNRGNKVTDNAPLRSGKGSVYEGGIRVPLIVRWPGVTPAGSVCSEPVISSDLYPTLLEISGQSGDASHNADVDGLSLAPLLKDPSARLQRDALHFHYPHYYFSPPTKPVSAIRARDWKLVEHHTDGRLELFRLKDDLSETHDLSAVNPEKARALRERLMAWRGRVGAQMPRRNPDFRPSPARR